jgi:propanol-preferring alcohol dehydrogenase
MARVQVMACGICGSDLHMFHGMPLPAGLEYPVRPGHEVAGRVLEVRAPAAGIREGDDVVLHIYDPCGACAACVQGRENRCQDARVLGIHAAGGLADEVVWPARRMLPVGGLPPDQAALLPDAVASAYHALTLAGVANEDTLCVVGAGGVGTHVLQIAQALWPSLHLGAVVRTAASAQRITELGIFAVAVADVADASRAIKRELGGVDAVVDFSGSAEAAGQGLRMLAPGGRLVIGSVSDELLTLGMPVTGLTVRELSIVGSYGSTLEELSAVVDLAVDGRLTLAGSVTHRFPLEDVRQAFHSIEARPPGLVRAVVEPGGSTD